MRGGVLSGALPPHALSSLPLSRVRDRSDLRLSPFSDIQRRKKLRTGPAQPKNAVSALNELKPGLEYKVIQQEGPTHAPTFTVQIEVGRGCPVLSRIEMVAVFGTGCDRVRVSWLLR